MPNKKLSSYRVSMFQTGYMISEWLYNAKNVNPVKFVDPNLAIYIPILAND